MEKLTFDELKEVVASIPQPAQSLGIFWVKINNANRRYIFACLKVTASANPDLQGFSLNYYFHYKHLPAQRYQSSRFYDDDSVCIDIMRHEFEWAVKMPKFDEIMVLTKNFSLQINW